MADFYLKILKNPFVGFASPVFFVSPGAENSSQKKTWLQQLLHSCKYRNIILLKLNQNMLYELFKDLKNKILVYLEVTLQSEIFCLQNPSI